MPGAWKVLFEGQIHHGLTIHEIDGLVRARSLVPCDLVCCEGEWNRVDQISFLRRHFVNRAAEAPPTEEEQQQHRLREESSLERSFETWDALAAEVARHSARPQAGSGWLGAAIIATIATAGEVMLMVAHHL